MIYFDNAATTKPLQEVVDTITKVLSVAYGNPSSLYGLGRQAKQQLEQARREIAQSIHANSEDIIFTSGGTESNNFALMALAKATSKKHIVSSCIEHPSVKNVLQQLEKQGYTVTFLPVDNYGRVSVEAVKQAVTDQTAFVSVMSVNNEVGSIQPIQEIAAYLEEKAIPFHTDAVQSYGVLPIDVASTPITALSVSAHKIHGPKGIGFLYLKDAKTYEPLLYGGGQERGLRSGTENLANILGFASAVKALVTVESGYFEQLQHYLLTALEASGIPFELNGSLDSDKKIAKTVNIWLKKPAQKLLIQLDLENICVSAGSACSAGSLKASDVLLAMYGDHERASESIRLSFSRENTVAEIDTFIEKLKRYTL